MGANMNNNQPFRVADINVDPSGNVMFLDNHDVLLEPRVMDVLCVLAASANKVVLRDSLIEEAWNVKHVSNESVTRVISLLRKAFKQFDAPTKYIQTVQKRGYKLSANVQYEQTSTAETVIHKDEVVRLAVLPFRTLTAADGQEFLADGIVDELITTLGKVPQLRIAGRTSSFRFKNANSSVSEIASQLNVSHLLDGAVHLHDNQLRISVSLIDGTTGFEVWSDSFDGTIDDVFASREDVARTIANGLTASLNLTAHDLRPRSLTDSREAYGLFLQGRALTLRAVGEGVLETAKDLLTQALEIDLNFAECWAALAETHLYTAVLTPSLERSALAERMADAARKAIALNPESGHARAMLGVYEFINGNPVAALDLAFEAYRLEPTNVDVMVRLGSFLMYIGRTRDAMPYIMEAIERDPVHGRTYMALCAGHLCLGEYDKAIAAGERMVDLGFPGLWLGVAQAANGLHEQAMETHYEVRMLLGTMIMRPPGMAPMDDDARDAYFEMAAKGIHSGKIEDRALYCQVLDGLHATMADPYDPSIAFPAIWMGHAELAIKIYREGMSIANMFGLLTFWSDSDPIRQTRLHPDFMSFAKDIGLVAAWEKYGWPDLMPDPQTSLGGR